MGGIFGGRDVWVQYLNRFRRVQTRRLCNAGNKPTSGSSSSGSDGTNGLEKVDGSSSTSSLSKYDAYKDLDKLDFMTAAKILFTEPPKKKKFGFDFHLVQLFFACMPSLAVYLVAQYARYEIRRMEAELEEKKKVEEEAKAKEIELKAAEEKEAKAADPELLEVKNRLNKLEEAVKEIFVEAKNQPGSNTTENKQDIGGDRQSATIAPSDSDQSKVTNSTAKPTIDGQATSSGQSKASGLTTVAKSSQRDQKGSQRGVPSQEGKK